MFGDTNARIGLFQQDAEDIHDFKADLAVRRSKDEKINSNGRQLTEFCNDYGLIVLNGRTLGDDEGAWTFVSGVGNSVNDLCVASQDVLKIVNNFRVEEKPWSDHLPISLTLNWSKAQGCITKMKLLPSLMWNERYKVRYQLVLNNEIEVLKNQKGILTPEDLTNAIKKAAPEKNEERKSPAFKTVWYNFKCLKARKYTFKMLNAFRKSNTAQDKIKYIEAKNQYTKVCKERKKEYYKELEQKINSVRDSKEWWKLARQIRGQQQEVGNEIAADDFKIYFDRLLNHQPRETEIVLPQITAENEELDRPFTISEIKNILDKAKDHKAPGVDRVPYEFLKNASDEFLSELTNAFNRIFETGEIGEAFEESIIFPIFKKGDPNSTSNYRGITFLNCIAKVLMGIVNHRLVCWIECNNVLNEFQAGFRRNYSTMDNIYNLASIVHLKFSERKKVYAFFVDFKAAFDKVPRKYLFHKLRSLGVSEKIVRLIENIYRKTKSAVWTGKEISDFFETISGVKQGCLLSPTLFTLYLNDLHDYLEGGLFINENNIRILLYADDIVILADDWQVMQSMISKLESYCELWQMEVNLAKSEMMIFKNGGRSTLNENFMFNGQQIKLATEFKYLGVILTPRMSFTKHVEDRNNKAKNGINATWNNFFNKNSITIEAKYKLFQSVSRSIQTYGSQIWGFDYFELVDKLQRYFLKRMLKLPSNTPNYALALETKAEENHFFSLTLHMDYIYKTIFKYSPERLPHKLSMLILSKDIFWAKRMNELGEEFNIHFSSSDLCENDWLRKGKELLKYLKLKKISFWEEKAKTSETRLYKYLDFGKGPDYIKEENSLNKISFIFQARSGVLSLNACDFRSQTNLCNLCNLREDETVEHLIAKCPIFNEFRLRYFGKTSLNQEEVIRVLNGALENGWTLLYLFIRCAMRYRRLIMNEYA